MLDVPLVELSAERPLALDEGASFEAQVAAFDCVQDTEPLEGGHSSSPSRERGVETLNESRKAASSSASSNTSAISELPQQNCRDRTCQDRTAWIRQMLRFISVRQTRHRVSITLYCGWRVACPDVMRSRAELKRITGQGWMAYRWARSVSSG